MNGDIQLYDDSPEGVENWIVILKRGDLFHVQMFGRLPGVETSEIAAISCTRYSAEEAHRKARLWQQGDDTPCPIFADAETLEALKDLVPA